MKIWTKTLCLLLALLMLPLGGCGRETEPESLLAAPRISEETEPGYRTEELAPPAGFHELSELQSVDDRLYCLARTGEEGFAVLGYDTLSDEWQSWALDVDQAQYPHAEVLSVTEGSAWLRLFEGYSDAEIAAGDFSRALRYFLLVLDLDSGEQSCVPMDFWRSDSRGHDPYLTGLVALDGERALLNDDETVRLISRDAQVLDTLDLPLMGFTRRIRIGDTSYLSTGQGYCPFDAETLRCGEPLPGLLWDPVYSSQRGRILVSRGRTLQEYDPETGAMEPIFNWMDVALRFSSLRGYQAYEGLENSLGKLYYLSDDRLARVSPGPVPVKKALTLGCFADASAQGYAYSETDYTCPEALLDAVMRFNQTDPEYRVTIVPMVWHDEAERSRLLSTLAARDDLDLLDTSLLPPGAVDRQLLVDLLPAIDADPAISREDFLPGLFSALLQNGGLYEYTDRFTMLTLLGARHLGLAAEDWTPEKALEILPAAGGDPSLSRETLLLLFSWAATAEFMDPAAASCSFDSPAFLSWLELLRQLSAREPDGASGRGGCEWLLSCDFASDAGFMPRMRFDDEAVVLGFPGAAGTGSYFMKLLPPESQGHHGELALEDGLLLTAGCNTSLGILAAGDDKAGAWRFVKTFMQGGETPYLTDGIPVLRSAFEQAVENSLHRPQSNVNTYASFNEADAAVMRQLVYATDRIVLRDEAVTDTLRRELEAFLGGKETAAEAAADLQSRLSLYMAEQYG